MNKIHVAVIGIQPLADGGAVVITRPSKENPSANGVFKLKAGAVARIAQRTLGIAGPLAFVALKQAIAASAGAAIMSVDAITRKAGDVWKNEATGETGVYGAKNDNKDWVDYRNHEIELPAQVMTSLLGMTYGAALTSHAQGAFVAPVAQPVRKAVVPAAITEETPGTEEGPEGAKDDGVEP